MSERPISYRTLDAPKRDGRMVKPAELIDVIGGAALTLSARRTYNRLLHHAFGPGLAEPGRTYEIAVSDLTGSHDSTDRLVADIEALMKTIVVVRLEDGSTTRVQLLGGNTLSDPGRPPGRFSYRFDPLLAPVLAASRRFGLLETKLIEAFGSKYALALYELVARRVRLTWVKEEDFTPKRLRELLGVPNGKLPRLANLKADAIRPAVAEVNKRAPFQVEIEDIKRGRRTIAYRMRWRMKYEAPPITDLGLPPTPDLFDGFSE